MQHDPRLRGSRIDLSLGDDVPAVTIDATQLKQVLLNMVVNAVDAMATGGPGGIVRVTTTRRDGGALVEVLDRGPGIPSSLIDRLFDPFFTTKADGLGVGLAISRSILEAAGGRIVADNATSWIRGLGQALGLPLLQAIDLSNSKQMIFGLSLVLLMLLKPEGLFPSAQRKAEIRGELEPDAPLEIGSIQLEPPTMPQPGRAEAGER